MMSLIPGGGATVALVLLTVTLLVVLRLVSSARKSGRDEVRAEVAERARRASEELVRMNEEKKNVEQEVGDLPDEEAVRRAERWARD